MGFLDTLNKARAYDEILNRQIIEDRIKADKQRMAEQQVFKDIEQINLQAARQEGLAAALTYLNEVIQSKTPTLDAIITATNNKVKGI